MAPKSKKQPQLCLVTYLAADGSYVHAVVSTAQRILLAQVGRLTVDHGLVEHDLRPAELKRAMAALKTLAHDFKGSMGLAAMHVPAPRPWGFEMPEPICTCRVASHGGRLLDPSCQVHGGLPHSDQEEPPGGYISALGRVAKVIGTTPEDITTAMARDCTCQGNPEDSAEPWGCPVHGTCSCQPTQRDANCVVHGEGLS